MTAKTKHITRKPTLTEDRIAQKRIKETKAMIELNQTFKGISWTETEVPTLTSFIGKEAVDAEIRVANSQDIQPQKVPTATDYLELIDDFSSVEVKANGHQINCSCINCQPRKTQKQPVVTTVVVDEALIPFNQTRYRN